MSAVFPFRAVRPAPEAAARVAAVPYDVVSTDEARALADGNPLSFLHVSRAEIDLPPATDPSSDAVYARAAENYAALRSKAPLVEEETPSLYFYRLRTGTHEQTGLAACYSLDEYDRDAIKKHERTRRDKEDDRTRHMVALRAQTGPVFLIYRARPEISALAAKARSAEPLFDLAAPDGVQHTIWRVTGGDAARVVAAFASVPALYIADGHHRAASAARTRTAITSEASSRFLAVAFPDNETQILPYHRVVKDLGRLTPESFLAQMTKELGAREGPALPAGRGEVGLYLGGGWYTLTLRAEGSSGGDRARKLDVTLLQEQVLEPVLGIGDVRTDKRIDFVGGARGPAELERLVDSGKAAAAFLMFPVTVADLMSIADAGGIMPPKSTWFEPKLRDGLLIHSI